MATKTPTNSPLLWGPIGLGFILCFVLWYCIVVWNLAAMLISIVNPFPAP